MKHTSVVLPAESGAAFPPIGAGARVLFCTPTRASPNGSSVGSCNGQARWVRHRPHRRCWSKDKANAGAFCGPELSGGRSCRGSGLCRSPRSSRGPGVPRRPRPTTGAGADTACVVVAEIGSAGGRYGWIRRPNFRGPRTNGRAIAGARIAP